MRIIRSFFRLAVLGIIVSLLGAAPANAALPRKPVLTVEVAEKMALACEAYAKLKGWRLNLAVVDRGGELLYFRRHIDSFRGSIKIAINKAWTASKFGFPTRLFGEVIIKSANGIQFMPRLIIFPGGLPIKAGKVLIGGFGVSGATGDQDEECAKVALNAVKGMLN